MYVYFNPYGGAVLAALNKRDEKYERELTRTGNAWDVIQMDQGDYTATQIAGGTVRGGKVEVAG